MMTGTAPHDDPARLLLVEDNPGDVRLIREAFTSREIDAELTVASDGEEALDFLHRRGRYADGELPHLVLLDLDLPKMDGLTVIGRMQGDPALARVPVVVLTTSAAEEDIAGSYDLHTNAYLMKPTDLDGFVDLVEAIDAFWLTLVQQPVIGG